MKLDFMLIGGFLVVALLSVGVIGFLNLGNMQSAIESLVNDELEALSFSRAIHIEDLLTSTLDVVKGAAELDLFQDNLKNVNDGVDVESSLAAMQEALEDINGKTNSFYEIQVADKNGIIVASSSDIDEDADEDIGDDVSTEDYFVDGLKGPFISDANDNDGVPTISYSGPIVTDISDDPIGVFIIYQAFKREINGEIGSDVGVGIDAITQNPEGLGESGEVYLVNGDSLEQ